MKMRLLFHRHSVFGLFFALSFVFSISGIEFSRPTASGDTGFEVTPQFLKAISSGFWPAACDALWLGVVQDIGEKKPTPETEARARVGYQMIQALDPDFFETYEQGASAFIAWYKNVDAALEVLDRGISIFEGKEVPRGSWNRGYLLYIYRAFVHGYLRQDFAKAKADYLTASEVKGAPPYLSQMRQWLNQEHSEKILGVKMLKILISNTQDPALKEFYMEKLKLYEPR